MNIEYVDWGVANHYGDVIEVNRKLKQYPELHIFVLEHEAKHTDSKRFNIEDLEVDVKDVFTFKETKIVWKLIWFMIKTPKTWVQLSPFYLRKKKLYVDAYRIIIYLIFFAIIYFLIILWRIANAY